MRLQLNARAEEVRGDFCLDLSCRINPYNSFRNVTNNVEIDTIF